MKDPETSPHAESPSSPPTTKVSDQSTIIQYDDLQRGPTETHPSVPTTTSITIPGSYPVPADPALPSPSAALASVSPRNPHHRLLRGATVDQRHHRNHPTKVPSASLSRTSSSSSSSSAAPPRTGRGLGRERPRQPVHPPSPWQGGGVSPRGTDREKSHRHRLSSAFYARFAIDFHAVRPRSFFFNGRFFSPSLWRGVVLSFLSVCALVVGHSR